MLLKFACDKMIFPVYQSSLKLSDILISCVSLFSDLHRKQILKATYGFTQETVPSHVSFVESVFPKEVTWRNTVEFTRVKSRLCVMSVGSGL